MFVTMISLTLATSSLTLSTLSGSPGADLFPLCVGSLDFSRQKVQDYEVIYSKFNRHKYYEQLNLNSQVFLPDVIVGFDVLGYSSFPL